MCGALWAGSSKSATQLKIKKTVRETQSLSLDGSVMQDRLLPVTGHVVLERRIHLDISRPLPGYSTGVLGVQKV